MARRKHNYRLIDDVEMSRKNSLRESSLKRWEKQRRDPNHKERCHEFLLKAMRRYRATNK